MTKFVNKIKAALEEKDDEMDERKLEQLESNLKDNFNNLSEIDKEIMDTLIANDFDEEECMKEAEDCSEIQEKVTYTLICIKDVLRKHKSEVGGRVFLKKELIRN